MITAQVLFTFIILLGFAAFVYWLSTIFPNAVIKKIIQALAVLLAFIAVIQFAAAVLGVASPLKLG